MHPHYSNEEATEIAKLLEEIKDESLRIILRKVIFNDANVIKLIKQYRPETTTQSSEN